MGRSLSDIIDSLPAEEQPAIDARYQEIKQEVEGLRELRQIAGKAQADIASALNIKQPSISQIERQTDMYLSTLRSYVEAVGGELELTVRLPKRPALRIHHLGDSAPTIAGKAPAQRKSGTSSPRRRHG
ncbi:XRE family transcriptional regulator [Chelativorans sp. ZYF759]|uniref:XRE family transcriptional regulator n=1 Tax=Chelativorans sp. ZYF759 TaxID=2692213 RepID=UPI00145DF0A2|nr:XRE family transcriptional regulator [Chelativorans sp. ZYF759]NMG41173.1 XRE family transcriptional regulator [Chelativorans sp. ZYF759]